MSLLIDVGHGSWQPVRWLFYISGQNFFLDDQQLSVLEPQPFVWCLCGAPCAVLFLLGWLKTAQCVLGGGVAGLVMVEDGSGSFGLALIPLS